MNTVSVGQAEPARLLHSGAVPTRGAAEIIEFKLPKRVAAAGTPPETRRAPPTPRLGIIRKPANSATKSGRRDRGWVLESGPAARPLPDPLMGWAGSGDVHSQIRIPFPDRE